MKYPRYENIRDIGEISGKYPGDEKIRDNMSYPGYGLAQQIQL